MNVVSCSPYDVLFSHKLYNVIISKYDNNTKSYYERKRRYIFVSNFKFESAINIGVYASRTFYLILDKIRKKNG
jgi:hypothetical protein